MAKKKSKEELDIDNDLDMGEESESAGGNKFLNILIVLAVIIVWLAIFALLIKMNVGGIGSMLRPYLKNIPGVNMILPAATDEDIAKETGGKYKNLSEAMSLSHSLIITRIQIRQIRRLYQSFRLRLQDLRYLKKMHSIIRTLKISLTVRLYMQIMHQI